ncbi:cyclase [bacterium]|nr:cyclase [bacterium]
MATAIIEHWLEDYDRWLKVYTEHGPARVAAGMAGATVNQDVNDPNHAYVIKKDADLASFKAFMDNPELKELMKAAGVKDIRVHIIGEGSVHDG